jgi:hypothetical protein
MEFILRLFFLALIQKSLLGLEMLYFSVILCIRQCFIIVSVYTIRGQIYHTFFLYYMFQPDGAMFRYIGHHVNTIHTTQSYLDCFYDENLKYRTELTY